MLGSSPRRSPRKRAADEAEALPPGAAAGVSAAEARPLLKTAKATAVVDFEAEADADEDDEAEAVLTAAVNRRTLPSRTAVAEDDDGEEEEEEKVQPAVQKQRPGPAAETGAARASEAAARDAEEEAQMDVLMQQTVRHARSNNRTSQIVESPVPQICKTQPCLLGVDEAGRGPVCGPMVYAIAFTPIDNLKGLKKLGFADSKTLKEEDRDRLFDVIKANNETIGWKTHIMSAADICGGMLSRTNYNLNEQAHDTTINLIKRAQADGVNVSEIYVDTVGKPAVYQAKLAKIFPNIKIVVESKADATYPVVSAASICAKVTRDTVVNYWRHMEAVDVPVAFGSGYPSDPNTVSWLRSNVDPVFGYPGLVRFSWSTAAKQLKDSAYAVSWEDDDSDDDEGGTPQDSSPFAAAARRAAAKKAAQGSHRFFIERGLEALTAL